MCEAPRGGDGGLLGNFLKAQRARRDAFLNPPNPFGTTAAELESNIPGVPVRSLEDLGLPVGLREEQFRARRAGIRQLGDVSNPFTAR